MAAMTRKEQQQQEAYEVFLGIVICVLTFMVGIAAVVTHPQGFQ
jgi:hypothetical protein